jgi:hypothetical protein
MIDEPYDTNITAPSAPSYDGEEMMDIDDDNGATLNIIQSTAASYVDKQIPALPTPPQEENCNKVDDATYEALLQAQVSQEQEYIDNIIECDDEVMAVAEGRGEVIVDATFNEKQLEQMKSLRVEDNDGNIVYKRTVLKQMNLGKSITKSLDCERRVRGEHCPKTAQFLRNSGSCKFYVVIGGSKEAGFTKNIGKSGQPC